MFRSIVASAAVMTLAVGASAQVQQSAGKQTLRTVAPNYGTYSLSTGFEVANPQSHRAGPAVIFDNTAGAEYYFGVNLFQAPEEWIDEVAFLDTDVDGDEQINGVNFQYCSQVNDTSLLGVVDVELRIYNDTVPFAGPTGWLDLGAGTNQNAQCTILMVDLPGDQAGTGIGCWEIGLDLEGGFECSVPQEVAGGGGITTFNGIGWMYSDNDLNGPFLDSIYPAGTVGGYGHQDLFEVFDLSLPLGTEFLGTFWYGGGAKAQGNFGLWMEGNGLLDTDVVNADAPGLNDNLLTLRSDITPTAGASVTWSCDEAATPGNGYFLIGGTNGGSAGFGTTPSGDGTLLVDLASLLGPLSPAAMSTGGGNPSFTTPALPAAVDTVTLYIQAVGIGAAEEVSNGLRHSN